MRKGLSVAGVGLLLVALASASEVDDPKRFRVASLAVFPTKWDKEANAAKTEKMIREAAAKGARLIVTPEGVLEGYVVNEVIREKDRSKKRERERRFAELAEPMDGPYIRRFRKLADELDVYLVLGFLERDRDKLLNTAALIDPNGRIVGKYSKTHFHQGYEVNPPGYTPGDTYPVFDLGFTKVGIMICFDRQPPEPARALALGGADVIVCPAYGSWGDWNTRLMRVRAYENEVYVIFTNPNHSLIIDPDGNLLGEDKRDTILVRDVDLSRRTRSRQSIVHRRPETYGILTESKPQPPP